MKRYLLFTIVFFLLVVIQITSKSYGFEDCKNHKINTNNLNSLNLNKYLKKNYSNPDINYFCSYNKCYYIKNEGLTTALQNYLLLQEQKGLTDYVLEAQVKGFPITEISLNLCK
ncbi:MAG: hypothetical protein PHX04_03425 [Bacilli bacterium]|nr:hypothetical protein [Bacilli bacterium]